jgi:cytochrome b561
MPLRNTAEAYGSVAKFLHWSIVLLILPQYFLAEAAEDYAEGSLEAARVMGLHQSLGLLVLVLQALLVVAAIHVAAALFHHFVLRDGTLRRMLPGRRRVT